LEQLTKRTPHYGRRYVLGLFRVNIKISVERERERERVCGKNKRERERQNVFVEKKGGV
jgi:hypothetical protein